MCYHYLGSAQFLCAIDDKATLNKMENRIPLSREQLRKNVHAALRAWHTIGGSPEDLLESLLLVKERRKRVANDGSPATLRLATNQIS